MSHMSNHWITTTDPARAAKWEHIFGTDRLPVLCAATRWDIIDGQERPCYDLAMGRLSTWQRERLAAYAARHTGRPYATVRAEIEAAISWPVTAVGCELVCDEQATVERPSPFILDAPRKTRLARRARVQVPSAVTAYTGHTVDSQQGVSDMFAREHFSRVPLAG